MNRTAGVNPVAGRIRRIATWLAHLSQAIATASDRAMLPHPQQVRVPVQNQMHRVGPVRNKT